MAEKTNLNVSPYYDDYDETKGYHKILYRAGRPVQARELTQVQSILQNQVERLGGHFFKEGALVQGAQLNINSNTFYIKVKSTNPNGSGDPNVNSYLTNFHGKFLRGQTTGVIFKVINTSTETTADPATLYGNFVTQGTNEYNSFSPWSNEVLEEVTLNSDGIPTVNAGNNNQFELLDYDATNQTVGKTLSCNITEGLVYTRGYFVQVNPQQLILEKYSSRGTYKVGLAIVEDRISSSDDVSLNDNSQGTTNENAAGADRLKISLVLAKELISTPENLNFIELSRVLNGAIKGINKKSIYGEFENTLAKRTHDTNGDFIVKRFVGSVREHLNTTINNGLYTFDEGGDDNKFVFEIGKGQAYVKGFDVTKMTTSFLDIQKARTTAILDGASSSVRLGNNLVVKNTNSLPDLGSETSSTNTFGVVSLYDTTVSSPGVAPSGIKIGYSRVRDMTLFDGTDIGSAGTYDTSSKFNLSLFDVKMFTRITGTTSGATFETGEKIIGATSGATGIISDQVLSGGSAIAVHDVVGTFQVGETINARTNGATIATTTAVRSYNIDRVRAVFAPTASGGTSFTADVHLDSDYVLTGTVTLTNGSPNVTGFLTRFTAELKEGDVIVTGDGTESIVSSVTDAETVVLTQNFSGSSFSGNVTRRRAKLNKQNQTANIFAWPRDWVATSAVSSNTIRKQEVVTISGGQFIVETGIANTELGSTSDPSAFMISVISAGSGGSPLLSAGDVLDVTDPSWTKSVTTGSGGVGEKVTFSSGSNINADDNNAQLLITYTIDYTDQSRRSKTIRQARCLSVESSNADGVFYGTAYDHKDISLGVSDVFKIRGVFEGVGGTTPLPPSASLQDPTAAFTTFETVIGQTTGAKAVIIKYNNLGRSYFYYSTVDINFVEGEFVVGQSSGAIATLTGLSSGSPDITTRYFFDNGQRDGYYDLAKLTLKPGAASPNNPILIVFDYFTSSGGDYYDVGSYVGVDYSDIPIYSPNKVDLGGLEPDGTFELSDAVDCRPSVGQVLGTSTFSSGSPDPESPINISDNSGSGARYAPFSYQNGRSFASTRPNVTVTGSSPIHTPVSGTSFSSDITFYVPRIDRIFLSRRGNWQISKGVPAITPTRPGAISDAIELFEIYVPAYTKNVKDVSIKTKDYRRYTMADIDRMNKRLTNLEKVTALSLLEGEALSKQILDGDGLDRFKSGFVVDNFNNHSIGDVIHPDYGCAIDPQRGQVRPKASTVNVDLRLNRVSSRNLFIHEDNVVTLPYGVINYIDQPKASRSISVNPFMVFDFKGVMKMSPTQDLWFDVENSEVPVTGNTLYDSVLVTSSEEAQAIGVEDGELLSTVWGGWQTDWTGVPQVDTQTTNIAGGWDGDPTQAGNWVPGTKITREITTQVESQSRNGVQTSVVETSTTQTGPSRVKSGELQQYMRTNIITVTTTGLKPNTNHFCFFDDINVDEYCQPFNLDFSRTGVISQGAGVKTNSKGELVLRFFLPNTNKLRFKTGQRMFKVTSSFHNQSNPQSEARCEYRADGTLLNQETDVVTTKTILYVQETISETQQITNTSESNVYEPYGTSSNWVDVPADTYNVTEVYNTYITNPPTPPQEIGNYEEQKPVEQPAGPVVENPAAPEDDVTPILQEDTSWEASGGIAVDVFGQVDVSYEGESGVYLDINPYCWTDGNCVRGTTDIDPVTAAVPLNTTQIGHDEGVSLEEPEPQPYIANTYGYAADFNSFSPSNPQTSVSPVQLNNIKTPLAFQPTVEDAYIDNAFIGINMAGFQIGGGCYFDPIAQSFLVTQNGGMFLHSVDVFFSKKDTSGINCSVEIRNMVNGHPGQKVLAKTALPSSSVNVSDNAITATTFKFQSPIYLQQDLEYCFVVISASADYEIWHSRIGENDITTGQQISTQPYLGSMFKSQNSKTWSPEQTDDVKFRLNICDFNTNLLGYMKLENSNVTWKKLKRNPIETFVGQNYVKVNAFSHGLYDTNSSVRLWDVTGDRSDSVMSITNRVLSGTPADGTYTDLTPVYVTGSGGSGLKMSVTISGGAITDFRITDVGQGYAVNDNLIIEDFDNLADITFNVLTVEDTIGGFPKNSISWNSSTTVAEFTSVSNITMDSFCVTPDTSSYQGVNKLAGSWVALSSTNTGGKPKMVKNVYYDVGQTMVPHFQPQGTKVFSNIYSTNMKSPAGYQAGAPYSKVTDPTFFTLNDNIYFTSPRVVASQLNEQDKMQSEKSLDIRIQFHTSNQNVSPVFDIEAMGFVSVMNRINSIDEASDVPVGTTYIPSTEPEGDNNKFVYVTKRVTLENPATSIKVFSDNFRPLGTELEFMYKIIKSDEETPVDDIGWEYFNGDGSPDIAIDPDSRNFKEYSYTSDDLPEFSSFSIKVVGKSENTSVVPVLSSFRALALA